MMSLTNRRLSLAVGIAGVLTANGLPAVALADGPTLYGQVHLSLDHLDNGDDSALNLSSNRSRLGVKGDIKIDESLTGIYQIESELRADSANTGTLASRNTFVGLKGGFGTVRAGRFDTPVKLIGRQVELFGNQVGDFRNLTRARVSGATYADERVNNSIGWDSADFSGFGASAQYSTNIDDAATNNDNDLFSVGLSYKINSLFVAAGFEQTGTTTVGEDDPAVLRVAGYYDLDALRITALWQTFSGPATASDQDVYGLGLRYHTGDWAFKGQAYQLSADADNADATLLALGLEYALSKPLTIYFDYATLDNDDNSSRTPYREGRGDNLLIAANGEKASAVSFGTIYRF